MITNNVNPKSVDPAGNSQLHKLYTSSQEMRLKAEAELQYTKRRLQTLSRLYEQSCKEIFTLRQQLNDMRHATARLRSTVP